MIRRMRIQTSEGYVEDGKLNWSTYTWEEMEDGAKSFVIKGTMKIEDNRV